jgi:osmotically-inducible protein OsmY
MVLPGCAVTRDQETIGAYIDDSSITLSVKNAFVSNKNVDASSISVETLNGVMMLSGFAKNTLEKNTAEEVTNSIKGVKSVKNKIIICP